MVVCCSYSDLDCSLWRYFTSSVRPKHTKVLKNFGFYQDYTKHAHIFSVNAFSKQQTDTISGDKCKLSLLAALFDQELIMGSYIWLFVDKEKVV